MAEEAKKIRSICIDTLTGIQNEIYMTSVKKPNHDTWMDYGKDIWTLISYLQDRGFEIIMVLGEPGTGKSTGMRTLESGTNVWFNADNKNPVWTGGKAEYGTKHNPKKPFHFIPKTYKEITDNIDKMISKDMFEDERFAILTGHLEDYKSGYETRVRLKTLGKVGSKMQLEGKLETVLYSAVVKEADGLNYVLETQNSGLNTTRSPMDLFEPIIPNDYQFIIDKLLSY